MGKTLQRAAPCSDLASKRDLDALTEATVTRSDPNIQQLVGTVRYLVGVLDGWVGARTIDGKADFEAAVRDYLNHFWTWTGFEQTPETAGGSGPTQSTVGCGDSPRSGQGLD